MKNKAQWWQFTSNDETEFELAGQRKHYWFFNPQNVPYGDLFMVKVVIPEGMGHDFHIHPKMNEILYVLQGEAEQWVEEEKRIMKAGDSVYIAANIPHGTFNSGQGELVFLAILSPKDGWEDGTVDVSMLEPYSTLRKK